MTKVNSACIGGLLGVGTGLLCLQLGYPFASAPQLNCPDERLSALHAAKAGHYNMTSGPAEQQCQVNEVVTQWRDSTAPPFFPTYIAAIQGKLPNRDVCEAHTLEQLLMPCEKQP